MVAASKVGVPAASAVADAFTGLSTGAQKAGATVVDRLNQPGPMPTLYSNPIPGLMAPMRPVTPAENVARLLREGRAANVTDDMMAQVDPQEMWRLYESGATGMDMSMDAASRAARAKEMGFDTGTPLYHGTATDFPAYDMGRAGTGPISANEIARHGVFTTQMPEYTDVYGDVKMPMVAQSGNYREVDMFSPRNGMMNNRGVMEPDAVRAVVAKSKADGDLGMSLGSRGVEWERMVYDPRNIRSQFARFDPRLRHLANLSAGVGGIMLGNPYMQPNQAQAGQ
jgi:hypothetical protein